MTTSGGRSADARRLRRGPAQYLLGLLLALAIGASIAMIFSPTRSIVASLAVIAALWAAVIGAILVTKFRRQADSAEAKARDLRLVYELQLEREITARRQYELGVEAQIRKEVRAESNEELHALQAQLAALRASLELLVGELPEQRVALQTERRRELGHARGADLDDGAAAERDFASTAPDDRVSSVPMAEPHSMTEVIPVVTEPGPAPGADVPVFVDETPTDEWAVAPAQAAARTPDPVSAGPARTSAAQSAPEPAPSTPWQPQTATPRRPEPNVPDEPVDAPSGSGRHGRSGVSDPASPTPTPEPAAEDPAAEDPVAQDPAPEHSNAEDLAAENVADTTAAWETSAASRGRDRHRRAPETEPGAHANGRSVSELIDQFRPPTPGGRRRRED